MPSRVAAHTGTVTLAAWASEVYVLGGGLVYLVGDGGCVRVGLDGNAGTNGGRLVAVGHNLDGGGHVNEGGGGLHVGGGCGDSIGSNVDESRVDSDQLGLDLDTHGIKLEQPWTHLRHKSDSLKSLTWQS